MHRKLAECIKALDQGIGKSNRPEDRKLASDYLAALAPLLAQATLGEDILRDLNTIERMFGNSWIFDNVPFEEAFSIWRKFRQEYERFSLGAMTVNERLFALKLDDEFQAACNSGDENRVRDILERAQVDKESITRIVKNQCKKS